jgi:hypothetical protein
MQQGASTLRGFCPEVTASRRLEQKPEQPGGVRKSSDPTGSHQASAAFAQSDNLIFITPPLGGRAVPYMTGQLSYS